MQSAGKNHLKLMVISKWKHWLFQCFLASYDEWLHYPVLPNIT